MKDKWNVHELHGMLVQEETKLMNQGNHSVHYVNNLGAGKKFIKNMERVKNHEKLTNLLLKSRRKMTNVIFVGNMDISRRTILNVKLGSKRKESIMPMYVLNQT